MRPQQHKNTAEGRLNSMQENVAGLVKTDDIPMEPERENWLQNSRPPSGVNKHKVTRRL